MFYLIYQYWKSSLTSLLVSRKNPYPSPSEWLPPLPLKQGNIPRRFHVSDKSLKLRSNLLNSWHIFVNLGRHLFSHMIISKIMLTLSIHAPSKA